MSFETFSSPKLSESSILQTASENVHGPLIRLPQDSLQVTDPDEEIFLLYSRLASKVTQDGSKAFSGLGSVDSQHDTLTVHFKLPATQIANTKLKKKKRKNGKTDTVVNRNEEFNDLEIELAQDKTALRSRKGDTGSVLWRVSVDLCQLLLGQLYSGSVTSLFDPSILSGCHVLELGAGIGLMSILLSPWVRHYTVTDLECLGPLIRKNIALNCSKRNETPNGAPFVGENIIVESLDWVHLQRTPSHTRPSIFQLDCSNPVDIIFAVDCIYNPSLLPALLETLDYFAVPGRTRVVVAVELRAEDVLREFLAFWLEKPGWEVWRVDGDADQAWMDCRYAIWVGSKIAGDQ